MPCTNVDFRGWQHFRAELPPSAYRARARHTVQSITAASSEHRADLSALPCLLLLRNSPRLLGASRQLRTTMRQFPRYWSISEIVSILYLINKFSHAVGILRLGTFRVGKVIIVSLRQMHTNIMQFSIVFLFPKVFSFKYTMRLTLQSMRGSVPRNNQPTRLLSFPNIP